MEMEIKAREIYTSGVKNKGIFTSEMCSPQTVVSPSTINPLVSTVCIFMISQVTHLLHYLYKLETILVVGKNVYFIKYIKSKFKMDGYAKIRIFIATISESEANWKEI